MSTGYCIITIFFAFILSNRHLENFFIGQKKTQKLLKTLLRPLSYLVLSLKRVSSLNFFRAGFPSQRYT